MYNDNIKKIFTKKVIKITAEEILKCRSCRELFPDNTHEAEKVYISLMKKFHPDVCSDSLCNEVSAVINNLYRKFKNIPEKKCFSLYNCDFQYIREYKREDGKMYFSDDSVCFILESELENIIYPAFKSLTSGINPKALEQAHSFLPRIKHTEIIGNGNIFLSTETDKGEFPLDEVLDFFGNDIDPRHCAWITSRLLGMCCFAELGGNVWNCLSTDNLMINPKMHTLRIVGGWWFSAKEGQKMSGVQSEIYDIMPPSCRTDGIARSITDLECVKAVCRKIFPKNSPKPMLDFAERPCMSDAFSEMEYWEDTIIKSFGGRYFTEMKICINDIYN